MRGRLHKMFSEYLKKVRASGRSYFTFSQAIKELGKTKSSVLSAISRFKKAGEINC